MWPVGQDAEYTDIESLGLVLWAPIRTLFHVWAINQPRILLEEQNLRPYPRPRSWNLHFNETPGDVCVHSSLKNASLVDIILLVLFVVIIRELPTSLSQFICVCVCVYVEEMRPG